VAGALALGATQYRIRKPQDSPVAGDEQAIRDVFYAEQFLRQFLDDLGSMSALRELAREALWMGNGSLDDRAIIGRVAALIVSGELKLYRIGPAWTGATSSSRTEPEVPVAPAPSKKKESPKEEQKFKVVEVSPTEVTSGASEWRQLVNLKTDKAAPQNGRTLQVTAKIDNKQAGVEVFFGLEPDSKNCGADKLGAGLAAKISASGKTDAEGVAKAEFTLSAYGGDAFKVLAGMTRDPKPDGDVVKSKPVMVWRKLWYQMVVPEGFNPPVPTKSEAAWKKVFVDFEKCDTIIAKKADCPAGTFYPEWMATGGGGDKDVAVVGTHNKDAFFKKFAADASRPLRANIVVVANQWDHRDRNGDFVTKSIESKFSSKQPLKLAAGGNVIVVKPALKGSLVATGIWQTQDGKNKGKITDADVEIKKGRASLGEIVLNFPGGAPDPTAVNPVAVSLTLRYAKSFLGESSGNNILAVYDASDVDDYNNTITHEVGHSVNQTPRPGGAPGALGDHPHFYDDINGGQGPHCSTASGNKKGTLVRLVTPDKTDDGRKIEKVYTTGICVMFHQYDPACIGRFCDTCEPYVRMQDMSKWK
jgi:hypothetical protein